MKRDEVLAILRANEERLRQQYGVRSLALFGSVARDEARSTSDVDLLVEFDRPTGYFGLVRLQLFLEQMLGSSVDLGTTGSLRPSMRRRVEKEIIRVA
ncbi:MAG TPA: nucleotidyltransferase family protein [Pirellulales bacterium]|nr:nucleotidyltransferase family protein [Pirellulales bacterium]